jgi:HicB family
VDLTPFVAGIRRDLTAAADLAGPDAAPIADRLLAAVETAVRLALLSALSAAAEELTAELAPGAVEVRLRGLDPEFVLTAPPEPPPAMPETEPVEDDEDSGTTRMTLRLPEALKSRIEAAATRERVSVNAWLVRALSAAVSGGGGGRTRRNPFGLPGQSLQGWVR